MPPIACTLASPDLQELLAWIAQLNAEALREHHGNDLELVYGSHAAERVRKMVEQERLCCAFLVFSIHEEENAVKVTINVPEAEREIAQTVFDRFLAGAQSAQFPSMKANIVTKENGSASERT